MSDTPTILFESILAEETKSQDLESEKTQSSPDLEIPLALQSIKGKVTAEFQEHILKPAEKKSEEALVYAVGTIALINDKVQGQFGSDGKKPSTMEMSFGIKISGGISAIVKADAECDISVKATWDFKTPSTGQSLTPK